MSLKSNNFLLCFLSATLLSAWYGHLTIFIFFAFVPLLMLEDNLSRANAPRRKLKLMGFSFLTFLLWNLSVTWWIVYASFEGACIAFLFNSLFMSVTFVIFSNIKNRIKKPWAIWLFIPLWLAFEYGHSVWDLAWIWLTVGNVFAFSHNWVQWYEFTGSSGGTLWVLFVNVLIFTTIKNNATLKIFSKPILKIAGAIIIPILISYSIVLIKKPLADEKEKYKVLVVQPNIDPYNVKFYQDYQTQFFKMLEMVKGKISTETDYLLLPETFITDDSDEDQINSLEVVQWFRDSLLKKYPDLKIVVGADTYKFFKNKKEMSATARLYQPTGEYYDSYNTALQIDTSKVQIYHKSKLVPGVEQMPFQAILKPLEGLALKMGGTFGSLGLQEDRSVFCNTRDSSKIAPVVCYESVFSDFVTEYVRNGATFIFIITNDGWWNNTPGHVQHLNYARLRAIENRRQIARCANTGISCFIDEFGNITNATKYWEEAVIEKDLFANNKVTFFSGFGDLISYAAIIIAVFSLLFSLFLRFSKPKADL